MTAVFGLGIYGATKEKYHPPGPGSSEAATCLRAVNNRYLYRDQLPAVCHGDSKLWPTRNDDFTPPVSAEQFRVYYDFYYDDAELKYLAEKQSLIVALGMVGLGSLSFLSIYALTDQYRRPE
ncbi:MAG TPA: hypothetical protein VLG27_01885 [Candidatus Saccharimonadia bacterium]|nr:hypothetical protein [Candidatus Saccharimonadia bacterium]